MDRMNFIRLMAMEPMPMSAMNLPEFEKLTSSLPKQNEAMPVLFTSHGNPMDIVKTRDERPFWNTLYNLGKELEKNMT